MFLKKSLPFAPVSGFVAFDGGGHDVTIDPPVARRATPVAAPVAERAAPVADVAAPALRQSATWQPASSMRVRAVEGIVILALCAYFAFAIVGLLR